jgi:hypothetical protein
MLSDQRYQTGEFKPLSKVCLNMRELKPFLNMSDKEMLSGHCDNSPYYSKRFMS